MRERWGTASASDSGPRRAATVSSLTGVTRILDQKRARLLGGDIHVLEKVLSAFEPHTEVFRKGKIAKPTELGKLVTIQESEHQIITAYEVHDRRPANITLRTPALNRHIELFDRPPDIAAGDRGFSSAKNEEDAMQRGGATGNLASTGTETPARRAYERQQPRSARASRVRTANQCDRTRSWFAALRYRGTDGTARWVGSGSLPISTGTFVTARAAR